jgi:hypothetical protein
MQLQLVNACTRLIALRHHSLRLVRAPRERVQLRTAGVRICTFVLQKHVNSVPATCPRMQECEDTQIVAHIYRSMSTHIW